MGKETTVDAVRNEGFLGSLTSVFTKAVELKDLALEKLGFRDSFNTKANDTSPVEAIAQFHIDAISSAVEAVQTFAVPDPKQALRIETFSKTLAKQTPGNYKYDPEVEIAQQDLQKLGFGDAMKNHGGADGLYGPATERAIIAYQESKGLKPDGEITPELYKQMQIDLHDMGLKPTTEKDLSTYETPVEYAMNKAESFIEDIKGGLTSIFKTNSELVASNGMTAIQIQSDPFFKRLIEVESNGDPLARPPINPDTGNPISSAKGLLQFVDGTGSKYDLDPKEFGTEEYTQKELFAGVDHRQDNADYASQHLGRSLSVGEEYLAHQQGALGAVRLLKNPDALAIKTVGLEQVTNNGGHTGMTNQEFANMWIDKFEEGYEGPSQSPSPEQSLTPTYLPA